MVLNLRNDLHIASITLSHGTAPVEVREQLACQEWSTLLTPWQIALREWAIITTCHRFELYVVAESDSFDMLVGQLCSLLSSLIENLSKDDQVDSVVDVRSLWKIRTDDEATKHLCRVAAGLDSLVLGEAQIQGQVIAAYTKGLENGTIGPMLSALFRAAIRVGKRARTETQISVHAASMSSIALNMAARNFSDFRVANVLVIGAGEMSQLALKALQHRQVANVTVANRTLAHAEAALLHPKWRAAGLEEIAESLFAFDVIFSATSAVDFVVSREQIVTSQSRGGEAHKQVFIDLAVPRDIDPAIRQLPNVIVIDVDDLRQGLDQSLENRKKALPVVEEILAEEIARWQIEQRELSIRPMVVEFRQRAERIRQSEVDRTMRFLGPVDEQTREQIQYLSRSIVNKLLHEPTVCIKGLAQTAEPDLYMSAICELFGLDSALLASNPSEDTTLRAKPSLS